MPHLTLSAVTALVLLPQAAMAVDGSVSGLVDVRYIASDSADTYSKGELGKFRYDENQIALGQLALVGDLELNDTFSVRAVGNSFVDKARGRTGITELYLKYNGLPDASGIRHSARVGHYYPPISLENNAVAWSPASTLTPSTLNSWIGEEIRLTGLEYSVEWLSKFSGNPYDLKLTGSLFYNNDPAGAMLAWHGWTQSSRQTVWGETLPLASFPALTRGVLTRQSRESDPFHEGDNDPGFTFNALWQWPRKGRLQLGYYHNNAKPYKESGGQYGWRTQFTYAGFQYSFNKHWQLTGQALQGSTLMQSHIRENIVDNEYRSAYLTLAWRNKDHRISARIEEFRVWDYDQTRGDNNSEYGTAQTLSHRYRLSKQWFMLTEYNRINSRRGARMYFGQPVDQTEQQVQLGIRYYF